MTRRILPREEWPNLEGTESEFLLLAPATVDAQVVVIEDEGRIVGSWAALRCDHAEGVWIHPDHRGKGAVARHLLAGMRELAQTRGVQGVVTAAINEQVAGMLESLGACELPGRHFVLPFAERIGPCQE